MSRKYRDVCTVVRGSDTDGAHVASPTGVGADAPVRFRWRYRTYEVRELLGFWFESGPWWMHWARSRQSVPVSSQLGLGDQYAPPLPGAYPIDKQVWRVSATTRRGTDCSGVYDLIHEPASGTWWLDRVWD